MLPAVACKCRQSTARRHLTQRAVIAGFLRSGVAAIADVRVSKALQQLHTWYSRLHNRLHGRGAHVFRAHFLGELESDGDLLSTCRYVARNPVEAGLVRNPFAWRWSSAAGTAGLAKPAQSLDLEPLSAAFDGASDWQARYRAYVENIDDRKGRWS
jgi:hypothetical protein